jgi:hypothetical protein
MAKRTQVDRDTEQSLDAGLAKRQKRQITTTSQGLGFEEASVSALKLQSSLNGRADLTVLKSGK